MTRTSRKPDAIRVAIVGCGRISDLHQLGYRGREDARITAVCDVRKTEAGKKAKTWGAEKIYTDYQQVLEDKDIDLVELLTPHHLHCPMTIQAAQAGKHISVQKPMALSAAEADEMITAANKAGVTLRVYETFVYYPPAVMAHQMIEAGEIGDVRAVRMHVSTGKSDTAWKIPLSAWLWRFNEKLCGGGPLVFDHGYHLFSLGWYLGGSVDKVFAWIDQTPVKEAGSMVKIDAPAMIMFKFESPCRYGQLDIEHTPKMRIYSDYYADDDRIEVVGEKGILFINRYTAKTVDLPELMLFKDGKTIPIPVGGVEWHDSFTACTHGLIEQLMGGKPARLDGPTGKAVLQFTLAALQSSRTGKEVHVKDVK
ncbi:MAG: Gfo/Idh/MocA family oxidoreductase [Anaerolineaceae bacterium]|nr:Gfo/Idh/MocA family oxidoreductase [Anaerolineaceae bacterium]MBN2676658.1 Gfo/Idh/MocA family oxidoreductase [Anaerolineaceae bacterium]